MAASENESFGVPVGPVGVDWAAAASRAFEVLEKEKGDAEAAGLQTGRVDWILD